MTDFEVSLNEAEVVVGVDDVEVAVAVEEVEVVVELVGPQGPPGPTIVTIDYAFNNNDVPPPGGGQMRLNAHQDSATAMYCSFTNAPGTDVRFYFAFIADGHEILVQDKDNATRWVRYEIVGKPSNQGTYAEIPIRLVQHAGDDVPEGQRCLVHFHPHITGWSL